MRAQPPVPHRQSCPRRHRPDPPPCWRPSQRLLGPVHRASLPARAVCKVAQVHLSSTNDKGWSWAHEQSLLAAQQELPGADLSIRMDSVPDDTNQAVEDLIERMVQQGANVVYTTSAGFAEPTRAVAARHPQIGFFNASGAPGPNDPPNVSYYNAIIEEGQYITG